MTLSVVIPILNEADQLPRLFDILADQAGIAFEAILIDGGSADGSREQAEELAAGASFPCRVGSFPRGRGRQLNEGVKLSTGQSLLFLHADSQFGDHMALAKALKYLDQSIEKIGHPRVAGHFSVRFRSEGSTPSLGFYFLECKAGLDRPGCIHGDQGYLLRRSFFDQIGPFDETLGFLEDTRLAQAVRQGGCWLLLPVILQTSSRRFMQEGFRQRQALNALIMNLEAVGRIDLLKSLPGIYRQQNRTNELQLLPFFQELGNRLSQQSRAEQRLFWRHTGRYIIGNAWQLAFWLDVRRDFVRGLEPGVRRSPLLNFFDRYLFRMMDHSIGYWFAGLLALIWFRWKLLFGQRG
jgi:glycosyltransferase involved in cell wall biosynthesis